jgi:hypothetical protein
MSSSIHYHIIVIFSSSIYHLFIILFTIIIYPSFFTTYSSIYPPSFYHLIICLPCIHPYNHPSIQLLARHIAEFSEATSELVTDIERVEAVDGLIGATVLKKKDRSTSTRLLVWGRDSGHTYWVISCAKEAILQPHLYNTSRYRSVCL